MNIKVTLSKIISLMIFLSIIVFAVLPANSATSLTYVNVQVGQSPYQIAIGNGLVYVIDEGSNQVSVINGTKVIATIQVGNIPDAIVYNSYNGYIYVANLGSSTVSVINGTKVIANVSVGLYPASMIYNPYNHYVYVAAYNGISVINGTKVIAVLKAGLEPYAFAYNPKNHLVYVTDSGLFRVYLINGTHVVGNVTVGSHPIYAIYDPYDGYVYVANYLSNSTSVINGSKVIATINLNSSPFQLAASPKYLYVTLPLSNLVTIISTSDNSVVANLNITSPGEIIYNPNTGYVYVTSSSNSGDSLLVLNGTTVIATVPIGQGSHYLTYYQDVVYVSNSYSNTVTIVYNKVTTIQEYNLTFVETGLPAGKTWYVYIQGGNLTENISSTSTNITLMLPQGVYYYKVYSSNFIPSPQEGVVNLTSSQVINIVFKPVTYTLTVVESGLPNGTKWSIIVNGTQYNTTSNKISLSLPYGIYKIQFVNVTGYKVNISSQVITLNQNVTIYVSYTRLMYTLTIVESGLPSGTKWGVIINSTEYNTTTNQISVTLPYGIYRLQFINVSGYKANVTSEIITLNKNIIVYVGYSKMETTTTTTTTTTSSTTTTTTSSTTTSSSTTSSSSTTQSTSSTTSTSSIISTSSTTITSKASSNTTLIVAGIVGAIIVIALIVFLVLRRR